MYILGLTGSIGMGKSTVAAMLRVLGVPVHDSDAAVHRLLATNTAIVKRIGLRFPPAVVNGVVDRQILGGLVFGDEKARRELEAILHPAVRQDAVRFLRHHARRHTPLVVLDIPLLFETGAETRVDAVIVVSAPEFLQTRRVLSRPGMTRERFEKIRASQLPDIEKRRRADYVVETGLGKAYTFRKLKGLVGKLLTVAEDG